MFSNFSAFLCDVIEEFMAQRRDNEIAPHLLLQVINLFKKTI